MPAGAPYQNRVDPFGAVHAVPGRGLFTGNRGAIHDPVARMLLSRQWTTKAWILCDCGFRNRKRDVMGPNASSGRAGWTNLFFLDEVTALAAGHRPCFTCLREKAKAFAGCFAEGTGRDAISAPEMDAILHTERLASGGRATHLAAEPIERLPNGVVITVGGKPMATRGPSLVGWTFGRWTAGGIRRADAGRDARLITPPSTVAALAAGYLPTWHDSVDDALGPGRAGSPFAAKPARGS